MSTYMARKFGHRDPDAIKELQNKDLAEGIKIADCKIEETCQSCIEGKMSRKPSPSESYTKPTAVGDLIHTDVCGSMQSMTPGKRRYVLTMIDDYSRFTKIYQMQQKHKVYNFIKEYVQWIKRQHERKRKVIRSDYNQSRRRKFSNARRIRRRRKQQPKQSGRIYRRIRISIQLTG